MLAEETTQNKRIVICADDFAQNPAISAGIIELLSLARINATSCMATSNDFTTEMAELKKITKPIDVGLHLNLTEGDSIIKISPHVTKGKFKGLRHIILSSFSRMLDRNAIYDEMEAQLKSFIKAWNALPDFIDGHQHIHHLPIIRDILIDLYQKYNLAQHGTYIRSVANMVGKREMKARIIVATGANKLAKQLTAKQIPHNSTFAGSYDFSNAKDFPNIFSNSLLNILDKGLIMCHPGKVSNKYPDLLKNSRKIELDYLKSDKFFTDMQKNKIILTKGKHLFNPEDLQ